MFSYLRAIYISSSLNSLIILFAPFSITGWYYLALDLCITVFHLFIKYFCVYCVPRHCSRYWVYISTQWTKQTKIPTVVKAYSSPRVVCGHLLNCRTPAAGGGGSGGQEQLPAGTLLLWSPCPLSSRGIPPSLPGKNAQYHSSWDLLGSSLFALFRRLWWFIVNSFINESVFLNAENKFLLIYKLFFFFFWEGRK